MKEIGVVITKINLVLENGSVREHTYMAAFESALKARQYVSGMQAYRDAYRDALDTLGGISVEYWLPENKRCQTVVLQSEV